MSDHKHWECDCEDVHYMHPLDGGCWHKACEGDMSALGCGEIVSGTPTDLDKCEQYKRRRKSR